MKSLFNQAEYLEIRERLESLQPNSERQWGKMSIAQMMAHCSIGFEKATGKLPFEDKSNFIMRTLVKRIVLNAVKKGDIGKNQKTFPAYAVTEEKDFAAEKQRLLENIDLFYKYGSKNQMERHPYFGEFSKDDWGGHCSMYIPTTTSHSSQLKQSELFKLAHAKKSGRGCGISFRRRAEYSEQLRLRFVTQHISQHQSI